MTIDTAYRSTPTEWSSTGRGNGQPITPDNAGTHVFRFLTVVGSGALSVNLEDGSQVDYSSAEIDALGPWMLISVSRVRATGTDAGSLTIRGYL